MGATGEWNSPQGACLGVVGVMGWGAGIPSGYPILGLGGQVGVESGVPSFGGGGGRLDHPTQSTEFWVGGGVGAMGGRINSYLTPCLPPPPVAQPAPAAPIGAPPTTGAGAELWAGGAPPATPPRVAGSRGRGAVGGGAADAGPAASSPAAAGGEGPAGGGGAPMGGGGSGTLGEEGLGGGWVG